MQWYIFQAAAIALTGFAAGAFWSRSGRGDRRIREREKEDETVTWVVGSPVSGEVSCIQEGEQPTVIIDPFEDKLYAPTGGKITKLYPMGNEFLFRTEFGAELHIKAGEAKEELLERYYRPRIVQNEIVGKGKTLLEFDRTGLCAEGGSPKITVRLENRAYGSDVRLTTGKSVKTGEEILEVLEHCHRDEIRRD